MVAPKDKSTGLEFLNMPLWLVTLVGKAGGETHFHSAIMPYLKAEQAYEYAERYAKAKLIANYQIQVSAILFPHDSGIVALHLEADCEGQGNTQLMATVVRPKAKGNKGDELQET